MLLWELHQQSGAQGQTRLKHLHWPNGSCPRRAQRPRRFAGILLFFASTSAKANNLPEPALAQLPSPMWLVHWLLFVYSDHPKRRTLLLETFLSPIPSCPWVLRHLAGAAGVAAATPLSSFAQHAIKEVVKVIQLEEYQYHDPAASFLKELSVEFDFETAQELTLSEELGE